MTDSCTQPSWEIQLAEPSSLVWKYSTGMATPHDDTRRRGPRTGDAFGEMLLSCLEGQGFVPQLVERDDGQLDVGDARVYFSPPDQRPEYEQWVIERADGRVLDIGCGAGRHALELERRGLEVVGLDVSVGAIQTCIRRGLRDARCITVFELASKREVFDTILLLGNNIGLFGGASPSRRWLATLATLARPGGRILGSTFDPYQTDNPDHLQYHAWNRARGRMGGQARIRARFKGMATPWFDYLFLSLQELEDLLVASPWRLLASFGSGPHYAVELGLR